jgi:L-serine dehydratase
MSEEELEQLVADGLGDDAANASKIVSMLGEDRLRRLEDALLTAAYIGLLINNVVPTSGSKLGCQAETGVGAAMGAAAVCDYSYGGSKEVVHAAALALKNAIGLTCDPVGGRVEVPCIKRSGMKAVEAVVAGMAARDGLESAIEPDAVVLVVRETGENMPEQYRETSLGGLAQVCGACSC